MVNPDEERTANRPASFSTDVSSATQSPISSSLGGGGDYSLRSPVRPLTATKALLTTSLSKRRRDSRAAEKARQQQRKRGGSFRSARKGDRGGAGEGSEARGRIDKSGDEDEADEDEEEEEEEEHGKDEGEEEEEEEEEETGLHGGGCDAIDWRSVHLSLIHI